MRFCFLGVAGLFILLSTAGEATAQNLTREQVEEARRHYEAATVALNRQDFDTAVTEYRATLRITKDATLHHQIAITLAMAGHFQDAVVAYREYMDAAKLAAAEQQRVADKIRELEEQLAASPISATPDPDAATGSEPEDAAASPGERGSAPDEPRGELDFEAPTDAPPPFLETQHGWPRTAGWVTVGIAAVLATSAGALAASAGSRQGDLSRLTEFRDPTTQFPASYQGTVRTRYEDAVQEGEDLERLALMAAIGAGAATGAAVVFFLLDKPAPTMAEPTGIAIRPYLTDDGVGVGASWGF